MCGGGGEDWGSQQPVMGVLQALQHAGPHWGSPIGGCCWTGRRRGSTAASLSSRSGP